jgi:hypothetical protein
VAIVSVSAATYATSLNVLSDPYAIFSRARQRWQASRYPNQLSYDVVVTVRRRGKTSVAHYHSYYDADRNTIRVIAESDEELQHPYTPHGLNTYLNLFGSGKGIPLSSPQNTFDYLGVPVLAPNYSFGIAEYVQPTLAPDEKALVADIRKEFNEGPKPEALQNSSGLKTIASVEATYTNYIMTLVGMEPYGDHEDYHISLRPTRTPEVYRLRDAWIDARSFITDRVSTQGNFVFGGPRDVRWVTTFRQIDGAQYIDSETTEEQFSLVRHAYDGATVSFERIAPTTIPPYMYISNFRVNGETGVPPLVEPP